MPRTPADAIAQAVTASRMIVANRKEFPPSIVAQSLRILRQHAPEAVKLEIV
jgi:hypothetical protein